jgi:hypothetical protein
VGQLRTLNVVLGEMAALLQARGRTHWAEWVGEARRRLEAGDASGLDHLLSAYGGMGSLNDVVFHPRNGDNLGEAELARTNTELERLRSTAYELATARRRER